jgi:hypothetical protein
VGIFGTKAEKCVVLYDVKSERNIASNAGKLMSDELEGKQKVVVVTDIKIISRHSLEGSRKSTKSPA